MSFIPKSMFLQLWFLGRKTSCVVMESNDSSFDTNMSRLYRASAMQSVVLWTRSEDKKCC